MDTNNIKSEYLKKIEIFQSLCPHLSIYEIEKLAAILR